jgi:hypothetical protein
MRIKTGHSARTSTPKNTQKRPPRVQRSSVPKHTRHCCFMAARNTRAVVVCYCINSALELRLRNSGVRIGRESSSPHSVACAP